MRKLSTEKRAMILTCLVEGNSIAATTRMTGASKVTILRLLADAGTLAANFHDMTVRNLSSVRVQMDEAWSFVHSKKKNVKPENWGKGHGDAWTWVSMDADTKLVINWLVGGRDSTFNQAVSEGWPEDGPGVSVANAGAILRNAATPPRSIPSPPRVLALTRTAFAYPSTSAYPTWSRPRDADAPPRASTRYDHRGTSPPLSSAV